MSDEPRSPCGNEDFCGICYPQPVFEVSTEYVARMRHVRRIKANTPEEARAIYDQGTSWPSSYDTRTISVLEQTPVAIAQVPDDDRQLVFHRSGETCWNRYDLRPTPGDLADEDEYTAPDVSPEVGQQIPSVPDTTSDP